MQSFVYKRNNGLEAKGKFGLSHMSALYSVLPSGYISVF